MKQIIFFLVYSIFGLSVSAQILMDSTLNQQVRQILIEGVKDYDDVNTAGVVVMEAKTHDAIANISVGLIQGDLRDIPEGDNEAFTCGMDRSVPYLSILPNVEGNRACIAIAFLPEYIIAVYIDKHGPYSRSIPTSIVGDVVNFMAEHYLEDKKVNNMMSESEHKQERLRPYER